MKAGDTTAGDISQGCDPDTSQNMDDELDIINEDVVKRTTNTEDGERSLLMAIDQAILKSIESCPTDEMKKKMYSSILIVGGGMKFRNAEKFLMQKLALQVSQHVKEAIVANPDSYSVLEDRFRFDADIDRLGNRRLGKFDGSGVSRNFEEFSEKTTYAMVFSYNLTIYWL